MGQKQTHTTVAAVEELEEFRLPAALVNQLYELTGDTERYKGLLFAFATEQGNVNVFEKSDSAVTSLALRESMGSFLKQKKAERLFGEERA